MLAIVLGSRLVGARKIVTNLGPVSPEPLPPPCNPPAGLQDSYSQLRPVRELPRVQPVEKSLLRLVSAKEEVSARPRRNSLIGAGVWRGVCAYHFLVVAAIVTLRNNNPVDCNNPLDQIASLAPTVA